mgnify:CR=1 FL=1
MRLRAGSMFIVCLSLHLACCFSCAKRCAEPPSGGTWTADRAAVDARLVRMLGRELFAEAESLADSMLSAGWRDPRLLGQKAAAVGMLGRVDEAVGLFEEAIVADYESCENHINFAVLLMRAGMTGRAVTELREAKRFCTGANRIMIFRDLAVGYVKMNRPDRAIEEVENGLSIAPNDPYLLGLKGMLIAGSDPAAAERLLSVPISSGEAKPEFLYQYGVLLINAERHDRAVEVLERAFALNPSDLDIGEALALALHRAKRLSEAEDLYRRLEEKGRAHPLELARVYIDLERHGEALALLSGLEPTAEILDRAAVCLMNLGRIDEAVEKEERALAMRPDWPVAMINLAVLRAARGELEEARSLLERVLEIDPDNAAAVSYTHLTLPTKRIV